MLNWQLPASAASPHALLDAASARALDAAAIAAGTPAAELMERAGAATAAAIAARWKPVPALVLAGPGNNGGDGYVVARCLREYGWPVRVAAFGDAAKLSGPAAIATGRWGGPVEAAGPDCLAGAGLVVDALFGTGLSRALDGQVKATVERLNGLCLPVVAVDIPSGIDSDTGAILGAAVRADMTVTFFRRKPGHLLLPGRDLAGEIVTDELGVDPGIYAAIPVDLFANAPGLWADAFPWPTAQSQKYTRGHALILGGTRMTGAARLAAHAAQRIGAGLVTVAADPSVVALYAAWRADLMISPLATDDAFAALLDDKRISGVLLGPGAGADARLKQAIGAALEAKTSLVLDADSFTILADRSNGLLDRLHSNVLLTPHEGEFARAFYPPVPRLRSALRAAHETGATILLKGSDTIVAGPDGKAVINSGAPPDLATGGSGDVLAGLAAGLAANRLPPMLSAIIACWVHGRAAALFGPGLIAGDIADQVPAVLRELNETSRSGALLPAI
jgi:NAD(P)H-hydrate epimerase